MRGRSEVHCLKCYTRGAYLSCKGEMARAKDLAWSLGERSGLEK